MDTATLPIEESWKLDDIFPDSAAIRAERQALQGSLDGLTDGQGRLGESAAILADALEASTEAWRRVAKLRCFAMLQSDTDIRNAAAQALREEIDLLTTDLSGRVAWIRPEILALPSSTLETYLDEEPRLAIHRFFLQDLMRQRDHVLTPGEERIMAEASAITRTPGSLFNVLHNVEIPPAQVTLEDGRQVELTPTEFFKHRTTGNRNDRELLFTAYYESQARFQQTLGENLAGQIRAHIFRARARRYPSCVAAALDGNAVPEGVYRNLIAQTHAQLPTFYRYFELRKRSLGVERLEYHDLHCPLTGDEPTRYEPQDAMRTIRESLAPLGSMYLAAVDEAFDNRWIDWHPQNGKRSGAYATGWAYDVHPYALLNFLGDYDSVSTATHELGHALHSYFSNQRQPFATADYSIFVAEVASTLNEALLLNHKLECADDETEQQFLLSRYLDSFRVTFHRQTLFAEFELEIHDRSERGEALTGERLNEIYLQLLRKYHGHDESIVHIDERYGGEWMLVPHFYYNFYVYQYATGIVASTALAEAIVNKTPGSVERYVEFLHRGGSDYSLQLLRTAGVDLEQAQPYEDACSAFERRLDQLEALLPDA
ncbi:MAG: oligoendopeptidase F [Acidobacteriota bacterium]|nr:oligoendopeptidase F [Acidobacteriota bacterium]MDH3786796.1 oligoendopeptidase F [Acidobacteriota bacterium]